MAKVPKSIPEQIQLLQSRNLQFKDLAAAPHFLSNISYYRLKGYWWEMQDDRVNHLFFKNSYFEDAVELYNFDRHLRLIVFNAIERIEISLRTKLIYHLSLSYGGEWYLNPRLFSKHTHYLGLLGKIFNDLKGSSEEFIKSHYSNHPEEHPEAWKALEILTLGTLSKLYQNLDHQLPEKQVIAAEFGLNNQKYLSSWLISITLVRNIIAHHGRLWNRVIINKYDWPKQTSTPLLSYIPNAHQRRKIFPLLSAILYVNNNISPGHHLRVELFDLFQEYPKVPLYKMGFPGDWEQQPVWKE